MRRDLQDRYNLVYCSKPIYVKDWQPVIRVMASNAKVLEPGCAEGSFFEIQI